MWKISYSRKHEPKLGQITVFYTFTFDLGSKLPFGGAVQKLLDIGIAETVSVPALNDVHLAPRYRELAATVAGAKALVEAEEWFDGERGLKDASWASRRMLMKILVPAFLEVLKRRFRRRSATEVATEELDEPSGVKEQMRQVIEGINESVDDRRIYLGVQAAMDRRLHEPGYLARIPFIRLQLRGFHYSKTGRISSFDFGNDVHSPDVTMLVHSSGVALLTIATRLATGDNSDGRLELINQPSDLTFPFVLASEPVLRYAARKVKAKEGDWSGAWLTDIHEGTRWRTMDYSKDEISLTAVFQLYYDAIISAIDGTPRYTDWMCYPTIFIDSLGCCGKAEKWMARHGGELERFFQGDVLRGKRRDAKGSSAFYSRDYSINESYSVWLSGGGTVCVNWEFGEVELPLAHYFRWTAVSENAVVRYWQLRRMDHRISELKPSPSDLAYVMKNMAGDMRDYRHPYMPNETAAETSMAITEKLGVETILQGIESRVAIMHNLVSMQESTRSARRANRLAAAAVLVALVVSLPAISEALTIVNKVPSDGVGGKIARFVIVIGGTPANAWFVFLLAVLAAAILALPLRRLRFPKVRIFRRKIDLGPSWENQRFRVNFEDRAQSDE